MKVYSVKPNSSLVRVSDGRTLEFFNRTAPLVIVSDVTGGEDEAKKYLRYSWYWGMFDGWADLKNDRAVTESQVTETIDRIKGAESAAKEIAARQPREFPEIINDTGVHKKS